MQVRCVPSPQAGIDVYVDEAEHRGQSVARAPAILTSAARVALPARSKNLDRNPITCRHTPTRACGVTDCLNDTDDFMSRDEGEARW
ncbi:hypothetical protein MINTM008_09030 [Mycobacterium intracellulare]|uniref:Uncharacterized protein n=2 Tax=Mycobacterium TaxID=1763 RepID=A0A7I7Z0B1_9MYCO|nr:hypothetical protein JPH1_08880 [Mycobacterium avium subsp. hominissuis]BBZ47526.1 hypothetical protein MPRM_48070 [Mycobacterium parmense]BCO71568.1 hypothetical protein MINTM008_09030 [Mycobacterium intracellulare]BCP19082.1 hypothetical protein MINTM023_08710 [Mycobacterium intracellulare]BCP29989.1 hypothetical protein MINTM026_09590 [Mycobacterium intracellulare]